MYTMKLHDASRKMRLACRGEGTEPDDEGEMDNFQDLQLGSLEPLVGLEGSDVPFLSTDRFLTEHEFRALKFNFTPPLSTRQRDDTPELRRPPRSSSTMGMAFITYEHSLP